jgi:hypothetical protein
VGGYVHGCATHPPRADPSGPRATSSRRAAGHRDPHAPDPLECRMLIVLHSVERLPS